jgi:hypothetical protein
MRATLEWLGDRAKARWVGAPGTSLQSAPSLPLAGAISRHYGADTPSVSWGLAGGFQSPDTSELNAFLYRSKESFGTWVSLV